MQRHAIACRRLDKLDAFPVVAHQVGIGQRLYQERHVSCDTERAELLKKVNRLRPRGVARQSIETAVAWRTKHQEPAAELPALACEPIAIFEKVDPVRFIDNAQLRHFEQ